jgi:3-hydroxyacyl-[acyl-carrier-protein] dehydratase
MRLDHARIRALLPHRHPMLLVDRVEELAPGVSLTAVKAVTGSEPCYRDLPDDASADRYAYPMSLLVESFGQAAAILWLVSAAEMGRPGHGLPMFAAARDCRLEQPVYPGDVVRHRVRLDQVVEGAAFAAGESWVGETRVASFGSMLAVIRPVETVMRPVETVLRPVEAVIRPVEAAVRPVDAVVGGRVPIPSDASVPSEASTVPERSRR